MAIDTELYPESNQPLPITSPSRYTIPSQKNKTSIGFAFGGIWLIAMIITAIFTIKMEHNR